MPAPLAHLAGLFEMFDLAQLLPESHAAYRPLLMDGLLFFLDRLRPDRLKAILTEQIALPPTTRSAARLLVLFRQCPTLHKLGQVVAHDRRLAPEMRRRLQELESRGPYGGAGKLESELWAALGAVPGLEISRKALAEGSVALVVPCLWRESPATGARRGVLKILRPGIGDKLHEELAILGELAPYLEERRLHHRLPEFDYVSALDSVARLLVNEVRLDHEQHNLGVAARFYAGSPTVVIPRLFPFCTEHITAMERIDGVKVTDSGLTAMARRRLAASLAEALLAKPLWSRLKTGVMFHADPHAGNLHVTADGRVAIFDWALVAEIDKVQREAVVQVVVGALTFDHERIHRALADLGEPLDGDCIEATVAAAVARVRRGEFPGIAWLNALLDELSAQRALRFPEAIILFRKALLTLSSVIADVSSATSIDAVVMREGWLDLVGDLALRPLVALDSRGHGGHLSTADLVGLWAGLPATVARFWRRR